MSTRPSPFFQSGWNGKLPKIVAVSLCFHFFIIIVIVVLNKIHFTQEPEPVKVFELVQLQAPKMPQPVAHHKKRSESKPKVKNEEPKKQEVKNEPTLPPEPKLAKEPPPKEEPAKTEPEPEPEPETTEDSFEDDMDLPDFAEQSGLNPVGSVDMDPLMQVYLERLKQIIMQHFNPPSGMNVSKNTKTSVQFTVDRFGNITDITLKRSSGNQTWDHLSMRAIQISKLPELPPNYRAPAISLNFNFTPN